MQYKQVDKDYFIYIEKNEKVMDTLTRFCRDQAITNGKISGIGAVKEIEIIGVIEMIEGERKEEKELDMLKLGTQDSSLILGKKKTYKHTILLA